MGTAELRQAATAELERRRTGGIISEPVLAEEKKAQRDAAERQRIAALADDDRWLAEMGYPAEAKVLIKTPPPTTLERDRMGVQPTSMRLKALLSLPYAALKPEQQRKLNFQYNFGRMAADHPLKRKILRIEAAKELMTRQFEKAGLIEPRRQTSGFWNELARATAGGTMNVAAGLIGTVSTGQTLDDSMISQWKDEIQASAGWLREKARSREFGPGIGKPKRTFVAQAIGQALPYMAAATAAAVATGTPWAAFAVGYSVEGDDAYRSALEAGASEEQAQLNRLIVGTINGAIESLQVSDVIKFARAGRGSIKAVAKAAYEKAWRKLGRELGNLTYDRLQLALREGLEEALQEGTTIESEKAAGREISGKEVMARILGSAGGGAVASIVTGGVLEGSSQNWQDAQRAMAEAEQKAEPAKETTPPVGEKEAAKEQAPPETVVEPGASQGASEAKLDSTVTGKATFATEGLPAEELTIVGKYADGRYRVRDAEGNEADIDPARFANELTITEDTAEQVQQRKETAIENINRAVTEGRTDEGTAKIARMVVEIDPTFDENTTLDISKEIVYVSEEIIEREGLPKYDEKGKRITYTATGSTLSDLESNATRTAIRLYRGHDADTVVEEWYHRAWDRLSPEEQNVYKAYHAETADNRVVQEHFAQEGRDFFFSEKLHEKAAPIRQIFEKFRDTLRLVIDRIRTLRGANIPAKIQNMYRRAGGVQVAEEGKTEKATALQIRPESGNIEDMAEDESAARDITPEKTAEAGGGIKKVPQSEAASTRSGEADTGNMSRRTEPDTRKEAIVANRATGLPQQDYIDEIISAAQSQEEIESSREKIPEEVMEGIRQAAADGVSVPVIDETNPIARKRLLTELAKVFGAAWRVPALTKNETKQLLTDMGITEATARGVAKKRIDEQDGRIQQFKQQVRQKERERNTQQAKERQRKRAAEIKEFLATGRTENEYIRKNADMIRALDEARDAAINKNHKEVLTNAIDSAATEHFSAWLYTDSWYKAAKNIAKKMIRANGGEMDYKSERGAEGSEYFKMPDGQMIRLSDHELPDTPARQAARTEGIVRWSEIVLDRIMSKARIEEAVAETLHIPFKRTAPEGGGQFQIRRYQGESVIEYIRRRGAELAEEAKTAPAGKSVTTPLEIYRGTGRTKQRGLAKSIETEAIERDLTKTFAELPEYQAISLKEQAKAVADLMDTDFERAKRIAMGQEAAPPGIIPEMVLIGIANRAVSAGDVNTLRDISTMSGLLEMATTFGQRIRALGELGEHSPVKAIRGLQEARKKAAKRKGKGGTKGDVAKIKESIKAARPKNGAAKLQEFIQSLQC